MSERAKISSSSSRSCSRLISLLTFSILDAIIVYTLKWWPGSCQSHRVGHACTELHTQLFGVEDAHQDAHRERDKTQTQIWTQHADAHMKTELKVYVAIESEPSAYNLSSVVSLETGKAYLERFICDL